MIISSRIFMWCYQVLVTYHGGHLTPCSFQFDLAVIISLLHKQELLFETYSSQLAFSFCLQMNKNVISSLHCADCFLMTVSLRINNHVKPWVKCMWKLSLKRSISHPFHIYFTIQNFTSMWNMHVKCLWKVCEKHVKIGHLSPCFHMTFTDILLAVVEHKHFRPVI